MKRLSRACAILAAAAVSASGSDAEKVGEKTVKLITLDPGHFHAALVQKAMYEGVDPVVHVYAPEGPDLKLHLDKIEAFNKRAENPTSWKTVLYTGPDFLEKMIAERAGNVVVISGNNAKKARYILECVRAGFNVLSDKPMAITPKDYDLLKEAFRVASEKKVLLYDIMTERYEITTILQKELSHRAKLFGKLEKGTPEDPSVTKESVHHFFKYVAGKPLQRPPWFFDSTQQGDAIVDVTTHLTDLVQWECFPDTKLSPSDARVLSAKRWTTPVTLDQFKKATSLDAYPDYLQRFADAGGTLQVNGNGEFIYALRGVHAKISVRWNFEAPEGAGDTHYSLMRGTQAALVIRQGAPQGYKPTLYVEPRGGMTLDTIKPILDKALAEVAKTWPGLQAKPAEGAWEVVIPAEYRVSHEEHFAQVTKKYLKFLADGKMPSWEVPNMLVKYDTLMQAYRMSQPAAATPAGK
jgi:predicted dehydrogenase